MASDPTGCPHVRCQSQVEVVTYTSDWILSNQLTKGSHDPILWFDNLLTELRKHLLMFTDSLYFKKHNLRIARCGRWIVQGMGEGVWTVHTLSRCATLLPPPSIHQPGNSSDLYFQEFIKFNLQPSSGLSGDKLSPEAVKGPSPKSPSTL